MIHTQAIEHISYNYILMFMWVARGIWDDGQWKLVGTIQKSVSYLGFYKWKDLDS